MYAVVEAGGRVVACGETESFVAPDGGQIVETDTNPLANLAADQEAYYDGKAFATRARTLSPQEQASKAAKALILPVAQGTVGKRFDALVATEVRALVALMLYQQGAIGADGTVQELSTWVGH